MTLAMAQGETERRLEDGSGGVGGATAVVRRWGWRASLSASFSCILAATFFYAEFFGAPSSQHIYGVYYALRTNGDLSVEGAIFFLLVGVWMRHFSRRSALVSAIVVPVVVLNLAFAWTSGVLFYFLLFLPGWLPQGGLVAYLGYVQFPAVRGTLDLYYLGWLACLFVLAMLTFEGGLVRKAVRSLELVLFVLLPLPTEVFLFDRSEFGVHVTDAQIGTPLQWFTNADLLVALFAGLSILGMATRLYPKGGGRRHGRREPSLKGPS